MTARELCAAANGILPISVPGLAGLYPAAMAGTQSLPRFRTRAGGESGNGMWKLDALRISTFDDWCCQQHGSINLAPLSKELAVPEPADDHRLGPAVRGR